MLPAGTVTFLYTDIQGSVPLWEREPEKMAAALQIHNAALRQAIEANGGAAFKTVGDAFQVAFPTAPQASRQPSRGSMPCNPPPGMS
jgi:class 3 adenylate cyclase